MRKIAFLTSSNMVEVGPNQREDAYEHDLEFDLFANAAAQLDMQLVPIIWDRSGTNWSEFDAVLVGTTWDYVQKIDQFFAVLAEIDRQSRLFNSLAIMQMNRNKQYLLDLAVKGVPTIPTICLPSITDSAIEAAFDSFGTRQLVVKPKVGAGAWRQVLLQRGDKLPAKENLPPFEVFVQPFLSQIQVKGELSMLFYDGEFSHAVRKTPKSGDYRIQSIYGGKEAVAQPNCNELELGKYALSTLDELPLYARVDLILSDDEQPLLIELELIEPYHYVEQGPNCGYMIMAAIDRRMAVK